VQTFVWQDLGDATLHNKSFTKIVKLLPDVLVGGRSVTKVSPKMVI
jgi:hypothetical protein